MAEAREKEPEVVLIGDTHIQRLAQHEVCECVHWSTHPAHWVFLTIMCSINLHTHSKQQNLLPTLWELCFLPYHTCGLYSPYSNSWCCACKWKSAVYVCICLNRYGIRCSFHFTALTLVLEVISRNMFFGAFKMVNWITFHQRYVTFIMCWHTFTWSF